MFGNGGENTVREETSDNELWFYQHNNDIWAAGENTVREEMNENGLWLHQCNNNYSTCVAFAADNQENRISSLVVT